MNDATARTTAVQAEPEKTHTGCCAAEAAAPAHSGTSGSCCGGAAKDAEPAPAPDPATDGRPEAARQMFRSDC